MYISSKKADMNIVLNSGISCAALQELVYKVI